MHGRFDLFVKVRAKDLNHMRDIIENKIRVIPNILETELMAVLKTSKDQIVSMNKYISDDNNNVKKKVKRISIAPLFIITH